MYLNKFKTIVRQSVTGHFDIQQLLPVSYYFRTITLRWKTNDDSKYYRKVVKNVNNTTIEVKTDVSF